MLRPSLYLQAAARAYPSAWRTYAQMLSEPPEAWARWCWCPLAAAYAIISDGGEFDRDRAGHIAPLGALAAWRATQGVYRFDQEVAKCLVATPLDRAIPSDVLERLPEHAPYIDATGAGVPWLAGGWVFLEHDANDGRRELRLVLDRADYQPTGQPEDLDHMVNVIVHLRPGGTLVEGLRLVQAEAARQAIAAGAPLDDQDEICGEDMARAAPVAQPLLALALYLCADRPEMISERSGAGAPPAQRAPPVRKVKGEPRFIPADQPEVWQVAFHLGRRIREARESSSGTHGGPRPHIRRAHWHTFWSGPRSGPQRPELRWLPPIAVGMDDDTPDRPTIREVTP